MSQDKGPQGTVDNKSEGTSSTPNSRPSSPPSGDQRPPSAPRTGYQGSNPNNSYRPGAPRPAGTSGPRPAGAYVPRSSTGGYVPPAGGARPPFPSPRPPQAPRDPRDAPGRKDDPTRINTEIKAPEVRLVGADGEMIGVVSLRDALAQAEEAGLDLVEVSPQAEPPVCKILDYGKHKYAEQKKKAEARKKQKIVEIKEIKLRPAIGDHDLEIKLAAARRFLTEGDKVKVTMRFRGREMSNLRIGDDLLDRVKNELENIAKVEQRGGLEGRQMIMILGPLK